MSEPCASQTSPAASAAEAPPDEPPGVVSRFQGLRVWPKTRFVVTGIMPISGEFDLATTMPPRASSRVTSGSDLAATLSA